MGLGGYRQSSSGAPRSGTSAGKDSNARAGRGRDELGAGDGRVALDRADDVAGRGGREVLDVGRDLDDARARSAAGRARARRAGPRRPRGCARRSPSPSRAAASSSTLNAASGGRAATSTAPAVGCSCAGPASGASSPLSMRAWSACGPPRGAPRACARPRARRRGRPAARARAPSRSASTSASAIAAPRSAASRYTIGATSIAPTRGCAPSWRVRSMRATAARAPSSTRSASAPGSPCDREHRAMVVRVATVDEPGAERGADGVEGRAVAAFGDVGNGEQHAAGVLPLPPRCPVALRGTTRRRRRRAHPLADPVGDRRGPPVRPDPGRAGAHVREQVRRARHGGGHGPVLVDRERRGDDAVDLADEDLAGRPLLRVAQPSRTSSGTSSTRISRIT